VDVRGGPGAVVARASRTDKHEDETEQHTVVVESRPSVWHHRTILPSPGCLKEEVAMFPIPGAAKLEVGE